MFDDKRTSIRKTIVLVQVRGTSLYSTRVQVRSPEQVRRASESLTNRWAPHHEPRKENPASCLSSLEVAKTRARPSQRWRVVQPPDLQRNLLRADRPAKRQRQRQQSVAAWGHPRADHQRTLPGDPRM